MRRSSYGDTVELDEGNESNPHGANDKRCSRREGFGWDRGVPVVAGVVVVVVDVGGAPEDGEDGLLLTRAWRPLSKAWMASSMGLHGGNTALA